MPAAAVIPAPIAYIKVVAVKKLVVDLQFWTDGAPPGVQPSRSERMIYPAGRHGVLFTECPLWPACLL